MLRVLRFRDFRLLWLGESASTLGDAMIIVAVGLFVTRLTGNPRDVGIVMTSYSAPLVVLVLFGGVVADRLPRRAVMIVSDAIRGILHATVAVLIFTGAVRVWHLAGIGVLFGASEAFFRPAFAGLLPQTVPEEEIQPAQGLSGLTREGATFVSPALATLLVLKVGAGWAFALDAASFAVSAVLLTRVRPRLRGSASARRRLFAELQEGWREVRARAWVWATIASFSVALFVALAPYEVLGAAVAQSVYGNAAVFGLASAAFGAGTITGAVLGARWRPTRPMRVGLLAAIPWPGGILVYALGPPVALVYVVMVASGAGVGLFAVLWETALAERIPPHLLSRVSAWDWMGSLVLVPPGYFLAGLFAAAFGAERVLIVGGGLGLLAVWTALLPASSRNLRREQTRGEAPGEASDEAPGEASGEVVEPAGELSGVARCAE